MFREFFVYLFFLFIALCIPSKAQASVVINEFLVDPSNEQWVELYNPETVDIDISGWHIDDNGGTEKFTIPPDTLILAKEYKVFESSKFNFNRTTPDEIKLLHDASVIDYYSYSNGPGSNNSFGREKDADGNWVIFSTTTKGVSNNSSIPEPTPTTTPTQVPTPTRSPTPTKIPTPTKTPKPKTPTPVKSNASAKNSSVQNTYADQNFITPTPDTSLKESLKLNASTSASSPRPTAVLGSSTKNPVVTETEKQILVQSENALSSYSIAAIIGGGLLMLCCGILYYLKIKNRPPLDSS